MLEAGMKLCVPLKTSLCTQNDNRLTSYLNIKNETSTLSTLRMKHQLYRRVWFGASRLSAFSTVFNWLVADFLPAPFHHLFQ